MGSGHCVIVKSRQLSPKSGFNTLLGWSIHSTHFNCLWNSFNEAKRCVNHQLGGTSLIK